MVSLRSGLTASLTRLAATGLSRVLVCGIKGEGDLERFPIRAEGEGRKRSTRVPMEFARRIRMMIWRLRKVKKVETYPRLHYLSAY